VDNRRGPIIVFFDMGIEQPRLLSAYLLSAFTVLVAAFASLSYTETAAVKITVPLQRLETNLALSVATQHIEAQAVESQQATTSTVTVNPQAATGQVVFTLRCSTALPCQATEHVPAGTIVATAKGTSYATDFPAMFIGSGTATVGVKAVVPGPAGNTGKDTITVIVSKHQAGLTVTNPDALGGGSDTHRGQAIQQSDVDALRAALTAKITSELAAALQAKAQGMDFVLDTPPLLNATTDHAVGDEVPAFTMTMTGTLGAIAFSDPIAQSMMRSALEPMVPAGYELVQEPIQAHYDVRPAGGSTTIVANAVGYAGPKSSQQAFSSKLKGLSVREARNQIQSAFPGSRVDIRLKPLTTLPWLPIIADHIRLTVIAEPATTD
jgi:hypothetical protein